VFCVLTVHNGRKTASRLPSRTPHLEQTKTLVRRRVRKETTANLVTRCWSCTGSVVRTLSYHSNLGMSSDLHSLSNDLSADCRPLSSPDRPAEFAKPKTW